MKTLKLGSIALLLLCGFFSCKKESLSTEQTNGGYADLTATSELSASATIAGNSLQTRCPDCVENFTATTSTDGSYGVLTLSGNSLTPNGTTIKTIASTAETVVVGSVEKVGQKDIDYRVNVTASHDADNVYFTLERVNPEYKFGNIEFYSAAVIPVPTNNSAGNQIKYGFTQSVDKIQIVRSRTSLGPCSAITFSFRVGGGGVPGNKDAETVTALTYVLRDLCPPSCSIEVGDYRTQTRGYWRNNNGQAFLKANESIFDLTIGDGHTKSFTKASEVKEYLELGALQRLKIVFLPKVQFIQGNVGGSGHLVGANQQPIGRCRSTGGIVANHKINIRESSLRIERLEPHKAFCHLRLQSFNLQGIGTDGFIKPGPAVMS